MKTLTLRFNEEMLFTLTVPSDVSGCDIVDTLKSTHNYLCVADKAEIQKPY